MPRSIDKYLESFMLYIVAPCFALHKHQASNKNSRMLNMRTIDQIRYNNLLQLVNDRGGLEGKGLRKLVEESEKVGERLSEPTLKQILAHTKTAAGTVKNVGDELARKIETHLGLKPGWMDNDHQMAKPENDEPDIEEITIFLQMLKRLKKQERGAVLTYAETLVRAAAAAEVNGAAANEAQNRP